MDNLQLNANGQLSIRGQSCNNLECKFYGQIEKGNIKIHSRQENRLQCKCCLKTWVMHINEPYFGLKTEFAKVSIAKNLLDKGESTRRIAREVGVSTSTIQRWKMVLV